MMATGSRRLPAYTPSLYLPGSFGRYRQYPRVVRTQIPGAGVMGGRMIWGSQRMNLDGAAVAPFSTALLPLLGLGQITTLPSQQQVAPSRSFLRDNQIAIVVYGTLGAAVAVGVGAGYWWRGRRAVKRNRRRSR